MSIPSIPPFKGKKSRLAAQPSNSTTQATTKPSGSGAGAQPTKNAEPAKADGAANKLNVNVSSFRSNPNAVVSALSSPNTAVGASANLSPEAKPESSSTSPPVPDPFFGEVELNKTRVYVKDDFNPFKFNKVAKANAINPIWPYPGKRYMQMFPSMFLPAQPPPSQQPPHTLRPGPPPIPLPTWEEGSSFPRYMYAYPGQPMVPSMAPPPPQGVVVAGPYIFGPFVQHMPYPPTMPPPNAAMHASPQMRRMPPPQIR